MSQYISHTVAKEACEQTFPVVRWLRICLPVLGTQVRSRVQEDPTWHRATEPVHGNYRSPHSPEAPSTTGEATQTGSPSTAPGEQLLLATTRDSLRAATEVQSSQKQINNCKCTPVCVRVHVCACAREPVRVQGSREAGCCPVPGTCWLSGLLTV